MQTIPKNRHEAIYDRIGNVFAFTLENSFSGKPIDDFGRLKEFLRKMEPKIRFNKATGKGQISLHSNAWYEFEVRQ